MITDFAQYHREYYYERRQKLIDYLGGQCVKCGVKNNLQFDHKNPADKEFDIKGNLTLSDTVKRELDKCQLLCKECHKIKTISERPSWRHGTQYAWLNKKCRCEVCKPKWRQWHDERNRKRRVA